MHFIYSHKSNANSAEDTTDINWILFRTWCIIYVICFIPGSNPDRTSNSPSLTTVPAKTLHRGLDLRGYKTCFDEERYLIIIKTIIVRLIKALTARHGGCLPFWHMHLQLT